jgi:NAD(P)-dependent dehydrogenase (short-subunit alcohol dehydrogenase family)
MPEQKHPPQRQKLPGSEAAMHPHPESLPPGGYRGAGKLQDKVAVVTGGDSGIGRSVAALFAREGAHVAVLYLEEHEDAKETQRLVEEAGRRCLLLPGNVGSRRHCEEAVKRVMETFGRLDVLVNNAGEQHVAKELEEIDEDQLTRTFRTNIFGYFFMAQAALPHMKEGTAIVNTTSVTAYKGNPQLIDYSATKGAIVSFTRSLALKLAERKIRVNAVAPGPIWTPLIPATFEPDHVAKQGSNVPMDRPGQPWEVATCFVFLASQDGSYMTGQVLHPNGGAIVNG